MAKIDKMKDAYVEMINGYKETEEAINSLPRGYISTKTISGHVYHYLQWRDGSHVRSAYVNDEILAIVSQKIVIRKQYEELLKVYKKDLKKLEKVLLKNDVTPEEIEELKA